MANIKTAYGSNNQAITCSIASLATGGARESAAVDNTTNNFLDALVMVQITTGATGVSATGYCNIYAYGSADGGSVYSDGATGADAAITLTSPPNMRIIGILNTVADATTYTGGPFSVATAFGGVLPDHWGIVIENQSGAALDDTEANHAVFYQGVYATSI